MTFRINEALLVRSTEDGIQIEFERSDNNFVTVHVRYGKDLDNLVMALLYISNSSHYGLENNELEWLALRKD